VHVLYNSRNCAVSVPSRVSSEARHAAVAKARHILDQRNQVEASRLLTSLRFGYFEEYDTVFGEWSHAQLHACVSVKDHDHLGSAGRDIAHQIARAFSDAGHPVDAIAVHVDTTHVSPNRDPLALTPKEVKRVVTWIGESGGYLGDRNVAGSGYFTYASIEQFYADLDLPCSPESMSGTTLQRFVEILTNAPPAHQARIVAAIIERCQPGPQHAHRTDALRHELEGLVGRVMGVAVTSPNPVSASAVVRHALEDARELLRARGATSAVDRVHTALHGYLRHLCEEIGEAMPEEATIPNLLTRLRQKHPRLQEVGPRPQEITSVLRSLGGAIDALQPVRNRASVTHPNKELLPEPEARFIVNTVHTIFNYIEAKVTAPPGDRHEG